MASRSTTCSRTRRASRTRAASGTRARIPRKAYLKRVLGEPLLSEPGAKFEYSNVGYALLAAIVEEVTRGPFEDYCEKHLFKPAKMRDTGFIGDRDLAKTKRASARKGDRGKTAAEWHWGWGYRGMGGVVSTVHDLHRWDRALRSGKVLDDATREILYRPAQARLRLRLEDRGDRPRHAQGAPLGQRARLRLQRRAVPRGRRRDLRALRRPAGRAPGLGSVGATAVRARPAERCARHQGLLDRSGRASPSCRRVRRGP